ncbi:class I SAM-dependent methyltransferase [Candidatus Woesebacteria bacterium]|nr:class I SAM-dependent methyltransferase [Candidatus Woesebacteria bacterium]
MTTPLSIPKPTPQALTEVIDQFLSGTGWVAPGDALLRVTETLIWRNYTFPHPILEIGCGDGTVSQYLYKHLDKIDVGVDLNPTDALATGRYTKTLAADARSLPSADARFQTVLSNSTFEHIDDDLQAIREVARVLKKGGEFWVTTTTPTLRHELRHFLGSEALFSQVNSRIAHYHYRSTEQWEKEFAKVGLRLTGSVRYLSPAAIHTWLKLFRLVTFRPYNRELWSYLSEERWNHYLPVSLIRTVEKQLLINTLSSGLEHDCGAWQLLRAEKI